MNKEKVDKIFRKGIVLFSEAVWGYQTFTIATNSNEFIPIRVLAGVLFLADIVATCTSLNLTKSALDIDGLLEEGLNHW